MSVTIQARSEVKITDNSGDTITKSDTVTYTLSDLLNDVINLPAAVAGGADEIGIFLVSASVMSGFDFLFLKSTVAAEVEFTVNDGDAAETIFILTLFPNQPFILGNDASYYAISPGDNAFDDGTLDAITQIRVKNTTAAIGQLEFMLGQI